MRMDAEIRRRLEIDRTWWRCAQLPFEPWTDLGRMDRAEGLGKLGRPPQRIRRFDDGVTVDEFGDDRRGGTERPRPEDLRNRDPRLPRGSQHHRFPGSDSIIKADGPSAMPTKGNAFPIFRNQDIRRRALTTIDSTFERDSLAEGSRDLR
jgi:hypothetical protein